MIIYDHTRYFGWGILVHVTGSAMFNFRSLVPALFSMTLAAVFANDVAILTFLEPRIENGSVVFSSIQFLVSLIIVNRITEANRRYVEATQAYWKFQSSLLSLSMLIVSAVDHLSPASRAKECENRMQLQQYRQRFLRWIRAFHVLGLEEFQGFESPNYRMGTLYFTEEILLFRDTRRATRVYRWLIKGYMQEKHLFLPDTSTDNNILLAFDHAFQAYMNTLRMATQIYSFPLAQASLLSCILYALWCPFAFAAMLPNSWFLAPLICLTTVWLTFGFNLGAQMLEWPFDGKANDLPLTFFSMRFIKEMAEIEFGVDARPYERRIETLLPPHLEKEDFVIPLARKRLEGLQTTKEWLERASQDLTGGHTLRAKARHRERIAKETIHDQFMGSTITEIRTKGEFEVLF